MTLKKLGEMLKLAGLAVALVGTVLGFFYQSSKSDDNTAAMSALISQLNDHIIPGMQSVIDRLSVELSDARNEIGDLRQDVGRLQGALRPHPPGWVESKAAPATRDRPTAFNLPKVVLQQKEM